MTGGRGPDAGAIAVRLAASLLLAAGGFFGAIAFGLSRLQKGPPGYRLPGSDLTLDPTIVSVFAGCAVVAGLVVGGLLFLTPPSLVRLAVQLRWPLPRRATLVFVAGIVALALALVVRLARQDAG